VLIGLLIGLLS